MIALYVLSPLLLILAVFVLVTHRIVKKSFPRVSYPEGATPEKRYSDYSHAYRRTPCSFYSGKNRLQGYIYGEENEKGLIVFAHGIGTGRRASDGVDSTKESAASRSSADCTNPRVPSPSLSHVPVAL